MTDNKESLKDLVSELKESQVLELVKQRLENNGDPMQILAECQEGMDEVGRLYEQKHYFVAGLIMAGEILREVVEMVSPLLKEIHSGQTTGKIVLGTVQGDIHDIGKDLFGILLGCYGFEVVNLGVDVPPLQFLEAVKESKPDIVALSALLTSVYDSMKDTVQLLKKELPENTKAPVIIIGGGLIDEGVCNYMEADNWAPDAMSGVRLCQQLVGACL